MGRFIPNENTYVGFTEGPVGAMDAPANLQVTLTTGTIAPATVSYIVTAFNSTGETEGSIADTLVIASAGGAVLEWDAVTGAEGYRIYGRTSGTESLMAQVALVLTWTDSGTVTPEAAEPPVTGTASYIESPTEDDVTTAIDLTEFVTGLNFAAQGNVVPTPNISTLFETSIEGTSQATATMDCYRDDAADTAWETLERKTSGFVIISRFGGIPDTEDDECEVWPVRVSSRTNANLTNNTVATFTVTFAVVEEPAEDAVVVA